MKRPSREVVSVLIFAGLLVLVLYTAFLMAVAGVTYIVEHGGAWTIFGVACLLAGAWFAVTAWRGAGK